MSLVRLLITHKRGYPFIDQQYKWNGEHVSQAISDFTQSIFLFSVTLGENVVNRVILEQPSSKKKSNKQKFGINRTRHSFSTNRKIITSSFKTTDSEDCLSMVTKKSENVIVIVFHQEKAVSFEKVCDFAEIILKSFEDQYGELIVELSQVFDDIINEKKSEIKDLDTEDKKRFKEFQSTLEELKTNFDLEIKRKKRKKTKPNEIKKTEED
ncbi:hypothetical protein M0813_24195 [Anaeramoeba flamelloides]|uniref:DUF262 domain-containing protein n=1 Tax=Anaeramoeba flamelloides TaxID=1746091 RepID=A0AAV7YWK2_9EUKA|nr:hypothetical protein M0812_20264 [Anaeramoeba flamelloides]KAJ6240482.1 hypothetical protein M0813_24195 [Anaeramoeba flamelloides]